MKSTFMLDQPHKEKGQDGGKNNDRPVSMPTPGNCNSFLGNRALQQIHWHLTDMLWPKDN